jgi:hypothetical protein
VSHRDSPLERRLDNLRAVLGPQAVEDALRFLPDAHVEELAARDERERHEADRTETALTRRETRDALLTGKFGKDAKAKAAAKVAEIGPNNPELLLFCAVLAAAERKAEYFRRLHGQTKQDKAP